MTYQMHAVTTVVTMDSEQLAKHLSWSSHLEGYKEKNKMSCKRRKQEQNQTVLNTVKPASWHQAQETWMKDATCCSSTHSLSAEGKTHIYHGLKIGATNLEAELLILILWPHFGVQNLAPVLGPQNTNRSQYGQQVCYCRRKLTAAHVRDTPRAQPWAHLGFEKKRPQCLNKRPTKAWGTNMYESQWLGRETTKDIAKNY